MVGPRPGVGISRVPTDHVLRTAERKYFVCCGVDLLLSRNLGASEGRTRCPSCGTEIRVTFASGTVAQVRPAGAMVFALETRGPDGRTEVCCSDSAIFDTVGCLRAWTKDRDQRNGVVLTVEAYATRAAVTGAHGREVGSPMGG